MGMPQNSKRRVNGEHQLDFIGTTPETREALEVVEELATEGYSGRVAKLRWRPLRLNESPGVDQNPRVYTSPGGVELTEVAAEPETTAQFRVDYRSGVVQFHADVAVETAFSASYYPGDWPLRAEDFTQTSAGSAMAALIAVLAANGFLDPSLTDPTQTKDITIRKSAPKLILRSTDGTPVGTIEFAGDVEGGSALRVYRDGTKLHVGCPTGEIEWPGVTLDYQVIAGLLIGLGTKSPAYPIHAAYDARFDGDVSFDADDHADVAFDDWVEFKRFINPLSAVAMDHWLYGQASNSNYCAANDGTLHIPIEGVPGARIKSVRAHFNLADETNDHTLSLSLFRHASNSTTPVEIGSDTVLVDDVGITLDVPPTSAELMSDTTGYYVEISTASAETWTFGGVFFTGLLVTYERKQLLQ